MKSPNLTHPALSAGFLSRLNDGEVTGREQADFESHRAACAECDVAAREFEAVLELYRMARATGADPGLASRLRRRLDDRLAEPARMTFLPIRLDVAWAATLVVALAAGLLLRGVLIDRARREQDSRILVADRIRPLPRVPATAPGAVRTAEETKVAAAATEPAQSSQPGASRSTRGAAHPVAAAAPAPAAAAARAAPEAIEDRIVVEDIRADEDQRLVPPSRAFSRPPGHNSWVAWTKASGTSVAVIRISVGADGAVTGAEIVTPEAGRAEDALILDSVREWRFSPARRDGQAVAGIAMVRLRGPGSRAY